MNAGCSIVETGREKVPRLATQPSSLVNPAADPSHPFCCDWLRAHCIPWIQWERDERKSLLHAETLLRVWDCTGRLSGMNIGGFGCRTGDGSCKEHSPISFVNAAALHNHVLLSAVFAHEKGEYISDPLHFPLGHLPSPVMQQRMGKGHAVALPCVFSLRRREASSILAPNPCRLSSAETHQGLGVAFSLLSFFVAGGKAADRKMSVNMTRSVPSIRAANEWALRIII